MHSVRIEHAKSILVGTRITYQATGNATEKWREGCTVSLWEDDSRS